MNKYMYFLDDIYVLSNPIATNNPKNYQCVNI